jgi:shikimate kinase
VAVRGIYLIGFSGTGKSTIARSVGGILGWPAFDLDQVIADRAGMTVPVIFEREGETGFRLREEEALRAVSGSAPFVVATGGGAAVRIENRRFMAARGWVITLEARPEALHARIQRQLREAEPDAIRPMLGAGDPLDRIRALKHGRQSVYALADWTVHTDRLTPEQVTEEVVRAVKLLEATPEPPAAFDAPAAPLRHSLDPDHPSPVVVTAGRWPYQAVVGWDHLGALGEEVRRLLPSSRRAAVLGDARTRARLEARLRGTLEGAGFEVLVHDIAPGERNKTLDQASAV